MAADRSALRTTAAVERRPAVAATIQRSAASASTPSRAQTLRQRFGNHATQALIARSAAPRAKDGTTHAPAQVGISTPTSVQLSKITRLPGKVSRPNEPAELEAEETARKVVRMRESPATTPAADKKTAKGTVQRTPATPAPLAAAAPASPRVSIGGGSPLPSTVRSFMEPRFGANFGNVRIHTGESAARPSSDLSAHAFTVGEHIFFGRDKFQPQSASGRELIAHELTHTIQQRATVQRSVDATVTQRSEPRVQRFGISDALNKIAEKANIIPGFRLLTIVLGVNPVNLAPVGRNAANLLRALLELIPVVGPLLVQALENHGIFAKVGAWAEAQSRSLGMVGSALKAALDKFLDSLNWRDILDLGGVWERAKRIFTEPIDRLLAFGKSLVNDILGFVRQAILLPLASLAEGTRGYDLLKAVLGRDPITGQPVPRNAETLIGGFMKLIGQEEVWENIKKANALARAWVWFQGAITGLVALVRQIPMRFVNALKSLDITDLLLVPKAFGKLVGVFGGLVVDFAKWAGSTVWKLLEIIFEVVSPTTLAYLRRTGAALLGILKNPVPFVLNLVRAAKLGFQNFADNFGAHLKAGLIDWLTGSLPGVYIPKAFSLAEVVKFVFSILGLTWQNIRAKLVKVVGETAVKAMETGFDIVVTLVTQGPAAAWDKIKEHLSNLMDTIIGGITSLVIDTVVKKAVPKLISLFIPGAGFISAILSIYDTIMVFVQKLSRIAQVVTGFVDSIVAIAGGAIDAAAKRVETSLAGILSLAISFLAGFIGLGNVAEKVMGVINKIRATIDKAIDVLIAWIVTMAKKLFGAAKAGVKRLLNWWTKKAPVSGGGEEHTLTFEGSGKTAKLVLRSAPEKPSVFLSNTAEKKGVEKSKRAKPISVAVSQETAIDSLLTTLKKSDEDKATAASGKLAQEADAAASQLDTKLAKLASHLGDTLESWSAGDPVIEGIELPRSKFTVEQKRRIAERETDPKKLTFNREGERINVAKGLARRHVVSSYDMSQHYVTQLNKKKASQGKLLLEQRGAIADARVPVETLNKAGIQQAATTRYSRFFGYVRNLFIGDSKENSEIQEHLDKGNPELAGKKLEDHVSHVKRAWALDQSIHISRLDEE